MPCGARSWPLGGAGTGAAAVLIAAAAVAAFARPVRYVVEGNSMAPRLRSGDVVATGWIPLADRFRRPGRYECWTVSLADHPPAVKRVTGLPGEAVSLTAGDLVIDGSVALKSPWSLAEVGSVIERHTPEETSSRPGTTPPSRWTWPSREVLDDATVIEARSRLLLPVRDVGLATVVHALRGPTPGGCRIRIRVGDLAVPWLLTAAGRHALVAGRLDGHLVAAAWLLPDTSAGATARSCLPVGAPHRWQVVMPWPAAEGVTSVDDAPPALMIELEVGDSTAVIEQVTVWRDVFYRSPNRDPARWQLGADEYLVLGDFPSESSDSRHWGPVPRESLHHRVSLH